MNRFRTAASHLQVEGGARLKYIFGYISTFREGGSVGYPPDDKDTHIGTAVGRSPKWLKCSVQFETTLRAMKTFRRGTEKWQHHSQTVMLLSRRTNKLSD